MIRQKRFSMNFRRGKREVPGLNTTSTADISFILLVFFLVISSMDSTKGVFKQLPPEDKAKTEEVTEMDRRNVMDISIWGEGDVRVDGKPVDVRRLQGMVEKFVAGCPDRTTHVVSIKMLPTSKYDDYFHVQDAVSSAYTSIRNTAAMGIYHKRYAECEQYERKKIDKLYPQRVMENLNEESGQDTADKE